MKGFLPNDADDLLAPSEFQRLHGLRWSVRRKDFVEVEMRMIMIEWYEMNELVS